MTYTEITSRKNMTILDAASLSTDKKSRDRACLFPAEGIKLFEEALNAGLCVKKVFFTQKALDLYGGTIEKADGAELFLVTDEVYGKLSEEKAPQGIFACIEKPVSGKLCEDELKSGSFVLLEDIQNPLNIGAILRCCYSMGFEKVIFSRACADIYSPKCARAAMGSLFKITPYFTDDMTKTAELLVTLGNRVFCTCLSDTSVKLGDIKFKDGDCFVIGNEGHGASAGLLSVCSDSLYIPMNEGAESLNAATAAAIVMWEMKKNILCGK